MTSRRLLIIHPGALGDFVITWPLISALRVRFEQVDVFCQDAFGRLAVKLGVAAQHMATESKAFASLFGGAVDPFLEKRLTLYDTVLFFSVAERLPDGCTVLSGRKVHRIVPRPPAQARIHVTDYIRQQLAAAGLPFRHRGFGLQQRRPPPRQAEWLIHPGSGSPLKNWPLERFIELHKMLAARNISARFVLGPAETEVQQRLSETGITADPPVSLAAFADRLAGAGGYIGNDAGSTHLAAFMGLPTVALFGPSDVERWRPGGLRTAVIRGSCPEAPCFEKPERVCRRPRCLERISAAAVCRAVVTLAAGR